MARRVLTSAFRLARAGLPGWNELVNSCRAIVIAKKYRPEAHYMRGPGPKWREKHADGNAGTL